MLPLFAIASVLEPIENAPEVSVRVLLTVRELFSATPDELSIITPPEPLNVEGNSLPVV